MFVNSSISLDEDSSTDFRKPDAATSDLNETRRMVREKIPDKSKKIWEFGKFWTTENLTVNQIEKLRKIHSHFTDEKLRKIVVPVIGVKSIISLRALDFFVINICKRKKTAFQFKGQTVHIYDSYRTFLRHQTRAMFDAFRRGIRLYFDFEGWTYSTTVGQLNYIKWAENMGVLHYAIQHVREIEHAMNQRISVCRKKKQELLKQGAVRVRSNLALESVAPCQIVPLDMKIRFQLENFLPKGSV